MFVVSGYGKRITKQFCLWPIFIPVIFFFVLSFYQFESIIFGGQHLCVVVHLLCKFVDEKNYKPDAINLRIQCWCWNTETIKMEEIEGMEKNNVQTNSKVDGFQTNCGNHLKNSILLHSLFFCSARSSRLSSFLIMFTFGIYLKKLNGPGFVQWSYQ